MSQLPFQTAREIRDAVGARQISAVEVCEHALARIDAHNPRLNAFLAVARDRALERARAIDREKHAGPLAGVPIALKDNIMTRGITTTAASKMLRHFVPPYDATVVGRLEAAGAVVMGKTNCDEFAMGSSTENSAFGPSRNPWNPDHISGGSSGGSAVAVAAGFSPIALGSDTGGSIRQPASLCGIVGLKPTYGRVSRYGLIAFASSLDQIGPMTRTAYDAAIALSVLAGADPHDSTASQEPPADYVGALTGRHPRRAPGRAAQDARAGRGRMPCATAFTARSTFCARAAPSSSTSICPTRRMRFPRITSSRRPKRARTSRATTACDMGFAPRARAILREMYEKTRSQGFGPEVKRRIMLGTYVLSAGYYDAYYLKAQQVRTLVRRDYDQRVRTGRCRRHADQPDGGVQNRREESKIRCRST